MPTERLAMQDETHTALALFTKRLTNAESRLEAAMNDYAVLRAEQIVNKTAEHDEAIDKLVCRIDRLHERIVRIRKERDLYVIENFIENSEVK